VDVDTPWLAGNSKTVAINFHGTNITTSNKFRLNVSGNRCWTNGSTDGSGNYTTCENPLTTVTVTPQTGTAAGCALVTMSMTSNTAYQIRGGEYVDMFYFSSLGNNGKFRVLANLSSEPCGNPGGPLYTSVSGTEGETMTFIFVQSSTSLSPCTVTPATNMHGATAVSSFASSVTAQEFTVSNSGTDLYAKAAASICPSWCGTP